MLLVAAVNRVAFVDDLGQDRPPVGGTDTDLLVAAVCAVESQPSMTSSSLSWWKRPSKDVIILITAPSSPFSNLVKLMVAGVLAHTGGEHI